MKIARFLHVFFALTVIISPALVLAADESEGAKIRVLIVTGDDVGVHDWLACSSKAREFFEETGRCAVSAVGTPAIFENAAQLAKTDVVYFAMCNVRTPTLSQAGRENLTAFVNDGGGFVLVHLASLAFTDWPEFRNLAGRVWVRKVSGHGPRGIFQTEIADHEHYITSGLEDFEADDELYAKLQGDAPIHVLVQAYSDWSDVIEPLAFTLPYGKGRVFHSAFGHDVRAMSNPAVRQLIVNGTFWAAGHDK